jgi:hypothetical protein
MEATERATPEKPIAGPVIGWHFVAIVDGRPVTRDGRDVVVGQVLREEDVKICTRGLHGSRRLLDAAAYAPTTGAPVICKCEFRDVMAEEGDKLVAKERKVLGMFNARDFVIRMAEGSAARAETYAAAAMDLTIPCPTEQEALEIERAEWEIEAEKELTRTVR